MIMLLKLQRLLHPRTATRLIELATNTSQCYMTRMTEVVVKVAAFLSSQPQIVIDCSNHKTS